MINPIFASTLYDGKMAVDELTIFSSDLKRIILPVWMKWN